jgi:ATP-dependent Clp protease ATP-binding subunit ClpA
MLITDNSLKNILLVGKGAICDMAISSIGQASSVQLSQTSSQDETKTLEQEKQALQKEINEINQDKKTSETEKQKKIQVIQAQIQTVEVQIQQLKQKKTEAQPSSSTQSNTVNKQDLIRQKVDIEV